MAACSAAPAPLRGLASFAAHDMRDVTGDVAEDATAPIAHTAAIARLHKARQVPYQLEKVPMGATEGTPSVLTGSVEEGLLRGA